MTHSASELLWSIIGVISAAFMVACGSSISETERREFRELERAFNALATAHPEDRGIRLAEIEGVKVTTRRVKEIKELCTSSYKAFNKANGFLAKARAKTREVEIATAEARALKKAGQEITHKREVALKEMNRSASSSLNEVTESLDNAEKLIEVCEKKRNAFRELISKH
ncbi:MAG: hypothetical protein GY854_13820 [Deltaproteobacteria bacterium]|nr:hypothetical protein [Deltaproteobacteria bacterium]